MIHIHQLDDTHLLTHNPELCREVTAYLLYCRQELLEYGDEDDLEDHDFNFLVLSEDDVYVLSELDTPEEIVRTDIHVCDEHFGYYRIIYTDAVYFLPVTLAHHLPFLTTV